MKTFSLFLAANTSFVLTLLLVPIEFIAKKINLSLSSRGLGLCSFTAKTWVQIPLKILL